MKIWDNNQIFSKVQVTKKKKKKNEQECTNISDICQKMYIIDKYIVRSNSKKTNPICTASKTNEFT